MMDILDYMKLAEEAIKHPPKWGSPAMNLVAEDNWSLLGTHVRVGIMEKLKEQPRNNPTDPRTVTSKAGGQ